MQTTKDKTIKVEKEANLIAKPNVYLKKTLLGLFSLCEVNTKTFKEKENNEKTIVKAFDIETNGKSILIGVYDGHEYDYQVVDTVNDINLSLFGDINFFYGDYDVPVLFSPILQKENAKKRLLRFLHDGAFTTDKLEIFKHKNTYTLVTQSRKMLFFNLMQYYNDSLYNAYTRYYDLIKQKFPLSYLTDDQLKEWKEDKQKRADFGSLDFHDPKTVEDLTKYNKLDTIATYQLAIIKDYLFPFTGLRTLPSNSINYIINNTPEDKFIYFLKNGDAIKGLPYDPELSLALLKLYKGGLFDSNYLGIFSNVKKYDINSMYPFFMTKLPVLQYEGIEEEFVPNENPLFEGTIENEDAKNLYIYYGCFEQNDKLVSSKTNHKLLRIANFCTSLFDFELTENNKELSPNIKVKGKITTIKFSIVRKHIFEQVIKDLYEKRLHLKKEKNPLEKVYKLILNSSYGKFGERLLFNAKFQNVIYAGMITALGRTYIVNSDRNAISYLTDSIITNKELPDELVGDKLGQFKLEGEGKAEVIGNGIYVLNDANEKMVKSRGFKLNEEIAEKVIDYIANRLSKGEIVRVNVSQKLMFRTIFNLRLNENGIVGLLNDIQKIISPLNTKQKYHYENGIWVGKMFSNEKEAKEYEKEFNKTLKTINPIDLEVIIGGKA
ncbi:hypothetical protein [Acidianus bottle-shaped virus 3 strain ABV3]|uniref:DNA-directed DNA polymerase n=1 Tax=Acidianus bottle-shaped virus 3 strain ABV3 TaxID=1732174 RepID=A0A0N7FYX1_9VIRU|nr:DNA polymerase [Acidianus bottle-shaped virus 3 strain ABV3]ALG96804.1 hypothetical protein [Acidianus bottle-shaped virus 3 strain ABV3]